MDQGGACEWVGTQEPGEFGRRLMLVEGDAGVTGVWWHPALAPAFGRVTVGDKTLTMM